MDFSIQDERSFSGTTNPNSQALHLEVTKHNSRVINLYRREGFVDHDRYLMTRLIRPH